MNLQRAVTKDLMSFTNQLGAATKALGFFRSNPFHPLESFHQTVMACPSGGSRKILRNEALSRGVGHNDC
jgi:hypothetical protein